EAHARAGRVTRRSDGKISVEIVVDEGLPIEVAELAYEWKDGKAPPKADEDYVRAALDAALTAKLKVDGTFEETPYEQTKRALTRAMTDKGFAYGGVTGRTDVDIVKRKAKVVYTLSLGPRCVFGKIELVNFKDGDGKNLPLDIFRASLDIKEGEEYSTAKLDS